uniref:EF-hand domain-containing protein n=1 Tax=Arundo donax TaxID=35708 RepID=A0A0A9HY31_ARUDO
MKDKQEPSSMADVYSGELTPLQRHVAFFDRNKDGIISPAETYEGFRAIGAGVALSAGAAVFINGLLGPKTKPENEKTPPFKFPIYVKNIHKGKHGSDTGVYDSHGRYRYIQFSSLTIRMKTSGSRKVMPAA